MDKSVIKFRHCDKDIFCFFVPEECPECGMSFSGRRLEEAPISIPNPFTNGHKTPCAFLIAPAEENTLREYDGGSDLHTGITDTNGVVYNYTKSGVRRDREGWEHCISIMLVQPDMYNLINQWDQYLEKFSSAQMWDPLWQSFNEDNHNCYSYTLMFINCVLSMQSKRALSKDEFTQTFILPRVKRASKYTMLCQEISQNHFYIVDSPKRDSREDQSDDDKDGKSKSKSEFVHVA
ncbi:MKRN2 opposite strand protein [Pangasianodon hypophthalmus]|uniref:MKRN2 opposite strand protein n=1 Tax=Pangasianodon hypophthalmus TaxID=310915 RepID=UPI002307393E|nr:MKRN2 opposite strand protein [Pangasianodon hypophthalmus]